MGGEFPDQYYHILPHTTTMSREKKALDHRGTSVVRQICMLLISIDQNEWKQDQGTTDFQPFPWITWNCHGSSTKACGRTSMWRPRASYASLISTRCCMWGSLDPSVPELFSRTGTLCQAHFQSVGFETSPGLGWSLHWLKPLSERTSSESMAEAVKNEEINVQERSVNVGLQKLKEVPWTDFAQLGPLSSCHLSRGLCNH